MAEPKGDVKPGDEQVVSSEKVVRNDVRNDYILGEELGRGTYGVVRKGTCKKTGKVYAVKILFKPTTLSKNRIMLQTEIDILSKVDHPNLMSLVALYETRNYIFLVMPVIEGGELFDQLIEKGSFSEKEAAFIIQQTLSGLAYLHSLGIAHRDLKPQNILCSLSKEKTITNVKITDFGLSKIMNNLNCMQSLVGTPLYIAPELLFGGGYNESVDLWAVGCILYNLLSGLYPFWGESHQEIFEMVRNAQYQLPDPEFSHISPEAKDLIKLLLNKNPKERPSAADALKHPWFKKEIPDNKIDGVTNRLKVLTMQLQSGNNFAPHLLPNEDNEAYMVEASDGADFLESEFDPEDMPLFLSISQLKTFRLGDIVFDAEMATDNIGIIVTGKVRIERRVGNKSVGLGVFGDNEPIPIGGLTHVVAVAESPEVQLRVAEKSRLLSLLEANPGISEKFWRRTAIRLSHWLAESRTILQSNTVNKNKENAANQKTSAGNVSVSPEVVLQSFNSVKFTRGLRHYYGTLAVTGKTILCNASFFTMKIEYSIPISYMTGLELFKPSAFRVTIDKRGSKTSKNKSEATIFKFKTEEEAKEAFELIQSLTGQSPMESDSTTDVNFSLHDTTGVLSESDWRQLIAIARLEFYPKDHVIIQEGKASKQLLFFLQNGTCRVEGTRVLDDKIIRFATIKAKEIFGEISFLLKDSLATASVVANEDGVCASVVSGTDLQKLMRDNVGFAGRFYRYLAEILENRFNIRLTEAFGTAAPTRRQLTDSALPVSRGRGDTGNTPPQNTTTQTNSGAALSNGAQLLIAIRAGDLNQVKQLFKADKTLAKWTEPGTAGWTALHEAAKQHQYEICKFLIDNGAEVTAANAEGTLPLHYFAEGQHNTELAVKLFPIFTQNGALVNVLNDRQESALHYCCSSIYNTVPFINYLLDNGASINIENKKRATPLEFAVCKKRPDLIEVLVKRGAQVTDKLLKLVEKDVRLTELLKGGQPKLERSASMGRAEQREVLQQPERRASDADHR